LDGGLAVVLHSTNQTTLDTAAVVILTMAGGGHA